MERVVLKGKKIKSMEATLRLCSSILKSEKTNIGVIEHIVVILCIMMKGSKISAQRIFYTLIDGIYGQYIARFLLDFFHSTEVVSIEIYNSQQVEAGKKKPISVPSLLYKIDSDVVSIKTQSYLELIPQEQIVDEGEIHVRKARDKLAAGAIKLFDVFFQPTLDNNKRALRGEKKRNRTVYFDGML